MHIKIMEKDNGDCKTVNVKSLKYQELQSLLSVIYFGTTACNEIIDMRGNTPLKSSPKQINTLCLFFCQAKFNDLEETYTSFI